MRKYFDRFFIRILPFLSAWALVFFSPFIGLMAMIFLIPGEEVTTFMGGRTLILVIGVFVFFNWLIQSLLFNIKLRIDKKIIPLVLLWALLGLLSTIWALDKDVSVKRTMDIMQGLAFFILIQNLINDAQKIKIASFVYFYSCVFFSVFAFFRGTSEYLIRYTLSEKQNPNIFARALAIGLLLMPYLISQLYKRKFKIIIALCAFPLMLVMFLTGSRGAWLGICGSLIITWMISRRKFLRLSTMITVILILCVVIILLNNYGLISERSIQRFSELDRFGETVAASRNNIWKVGWQMVKANPIVGVGLENFAVRFEEYVPAANVYGFPGMSHDRTPHSIFLSVFAELGFVGFMILLAIFWILLKRFLTSDFRSSYSGISGILMTLFIIFSGLTATIQYTKFFWFAIGLSSLMPAVTKNEKY